MELFYRDFQQGVNVSWDQLINELNDKKSYNTYCYSENYLEVFKQLIFSLLIDRKITLLDGDFTQEEITKLTGLSLSEIKKANEETELKFHIQSKVELLSKLAEPKTNWEIQLFTSGTTGVPKKVAHTFESITRFVKVSKTSHLNIWGFAFNPTHMAGIQVFFQAILNGNTLVRLFGLSKEHIFDEIQLNSITHISATPTFYRLLLPFSGSMQTVGRLTFGGEKFDDYTLKQIGTLFPNARITNVYASTEAGTILAADGEIFTIKENFQNLVKIEKDELLIHRSLLGEITNVNITDWYQTGDLVEIISTEPLKFRFLQRKNEMINVGGYKVNPIEVEETIRMYPGVNDVRVFAKENSVLGKIIIAEVVCENKSIKEAEIRNFLTTKMQEFKIPRMFKFVSELTLTRTGKVKRD